MRGMWGPERSIGGMGRTFGLHHHHHGVDPDDESIRDQPITRARLGRVLSYFKPYWAQWLAILLCIAATSGLGVLPPLCVRGILDHAIPGHNPRLLHLLVGAIVAPAGTDEDAVKAWLKDLAAIRAPAVDEP